MKSKHKCSIRVTLDALPPEDAAALRGVLNPDSGWTHAAIERELKAEDITLSQSTISRHRNGQCLCEPDEA